MIIQVICVRIDPCSQTTCSKATNNHQRSPIPSSPSSISSCFISASHSFKCLTFIPIAPAARLLHSWPTTALNFKSVRALSGTLEGSMLSRIAHPGGGQRYIAGSSYQFVWPTSMGMVLAPSPPPSNSTPSGGTTPQCTPPPLGICCCRPLEAIRLQTRLDFAPKVTHRCLGEHALPMQHCTVVDNFHVALVINLLARCSPWEGGKPSVAVALCSQRLAGSKGHGGGRGGIIASGGGTALIPPTPSA
jgi:hypothetical protein